VTQTYVTFYVTLCYIELLKVAMLPKQTTMAHVNLPTSLLSFIHIIVYCLDVDIWHGWWWRSVATATIRSQRAANQSPFPWQRRAGATKCRHETVYILL